MISSNQLICPVCAGTKKVNGEWCRNCGGQYPGSGASGIAESRPDGTACIHEYQLFKTCENGHTEHKCIHCGDHYTTDPGT